MQISCAHRDLAARKRRRLGWAALFLAILCALAWQLSRTREPVYQGKPLSAWLRYYALGADPREALKANQAVREIGTNAIPTLLRMLQRKDSALKVKLLALGQRQLFVRIPYVAAVDRKVEAIQAFGVLGSSARSAVPELVQLYEQSIPGDPQSQWQAVAALSCIGPAAEDAIPSFLRDATNADRLVRADAIVALGMLHIAPGLVVPALVEALRDPDDLVRIAAAESLGQFGGLAKPALPALTELLQAENQELRDKAENTLKKIAPDAVK